MTVSIVRQVRMLGIRKGLRSWWRYGGSVPVPEVRIHHGARPSLPGYRRKR